MDLANVLEGYFRQDRLLLLQKFARISTPLLSLWEMKKNQEIHKIALNLHNFYLLKEIICVCLWFLILKEFKV